ncbi:dihydrolipoyl dehydrogenase [Maritimibacter sp. UBA3975]|uniref:dihydrolipoyl dehydrogenase n=1 Tax=Maritimibacter sp. UBA3975 TaxID=1946833 RepID=UPI000C0A80DA|nr:dihydrolipoyl dehydrogenase [Maritimibacter sp. UBA3975]MAM63613.1 dihydrolipoyl dehydrogenase [Maritimibacter sp.]|tara:strand:- start:5334 stop:6734 length:1401 start_codon:yes stop_codon:yes gene_type:complete
MADLTCDVAIIGAGTAGIAAERKARKQGARTLLIDPNFSGTTCATVGCMPSKLLIAAARRAHTVRTAGTFGIDTGPARIDGPAVMSRVREERDRFVAGVQSGFDDLPDGVRVQARASFTSPTTLELDDGRSVEAGAIVIATGSAPMIPPPFRELGEALLTNETVFDIEDLPDSLAVIGAGALGLELAQAFARLGVTVAVFDQGETLAGARCDKVQASLRGVIEDDMTLHLGTNPDPSRDRDGVRIDWDGGSQTFDRVLVAAGRPPSVEGLELEKTGLALDDKGMPTVDAATLQCGDAPIFMVGDGNGIRPVLHEASTEGAVAGRNAALWPDIERAKRSVPLTITFTQPPLASVGTGPDESDKIGSADYTDQGRAKVDDVAVGLVRLYAAAPDGRLTGADLFCPGADHLGHLIAWAIESGRTASELLDHPFYHPTLEEGLRGALREICGSVPLELPADRDEGSPPGD